MSDFYYYVQDTTTIQDHLVDAHESVKGAVA